MSKFSDKAIINASNLTVLEGRGGDGMKRIAQRLLVSLSISAETVEDYYDAFIIFPLDRNKCITMDSLKSFYDKAGLELSEEECEDAMRAFTGRNVLILINVVTYM